MKNNNHFHHKQQQPKRKGRRRREQDAMWIPYLGAIAMIVVYVVFQITYQAALTVEAAATTSDQITTLDRLSHFIESGTDYIVRMCHSPSQDVPERVGKFTYVAYLKDNYEEDYNFFENDQDDYNLLRHNGAIYSLVLSYQRTPSPVVLDVIQRSVGWLKDAAIGPVPDMTERDDDAGEEVKYIPELLAAWEDGKILGGGSQMKPTAKLGGAGLALIALCGLETIHPGTTPLQELRQLGNFISYLQNDDDGSFTCRYKPHKGGKDTSFVSLYYPGEAALGLIALAELEDDESLFKQRWIKIATRALLYLETLRRNQELDEVEPDHWALLATARLLPLLDDSSSDYWHVYQHAIKVMTSMVSVVDTVDDLLEVHGCHTQDGRTCPTSTRLEGLLAGLTFLKEDELFLQDGGLPAIPLKERILQFVEHGADFVLRAMEESSTHASMHGAVPVRFFADDPSVELRTKDTEVRIDYVQHSISAMMAYEQLLLHEGPYASWASRKEKLQKAASHVRHKVADVIRHPAQEENQGALLWMLLVVVLVMVVAGNIIMNQSKGSATKKSE